MKPGFSVAALAALSIAGCSQSVASDPKICRIVPTIEAEAKKHEAPGTPMADALLADDEINSCLMRRAYRYSSAAGDMAQIAKAVVTACEFQINDAARLTVKAYYSDLTGLEKTKVYSETRSDSLQDAEKKALLYVVEGRAGRCGPAVKG